MNKVTTMLDAAAAVIADIRSLADSLQVLVDAVSRRCRRKSQPRNLSRNRNRRKRNHFLWKMSELCVLRNPAKVLRPR